MSHAGLVWANLRRRPAQSLLGLACATLAFAVYGVMFGILDSFHHGSIQNAAFEQQLLRIAIVMSAAGMALILLLTAGAMAHAVRLRLYEFGVLKALGFSHRRIVALVVAEAAVPCVAGALLGLALVPLLFAALAAGAPQLATLPPPAYSCATLIGALIIALLLALLASVLPALRIVRLDAAAALTGSAEARAPVSSVDAGMSRTEQVAVAAPSADRRTFVTAEAIPGLLRQVFIVTRIGFSTLAQRSRSAWLITVGVFCTTFVLLWVLSTAEAIHSSITSSGDPARVVLRASSTARLHDSRLPDGIPALVADAPGVAKAADGSPLAEAVFFANIGTSFRGSSGRRALLEIVGVGPHWREMTPSFRLLSGRLPRPGTHEVIVGRLAQRALTGLDAGPIDSTIEVNRGLVRGVKWQAVGTFTTDNWWDGYVIGDIAALRQYSGELTATAAFVRLDSPQSFDAFKREVTPRLPSSVKVEREADTYAAFWDSIVPKALLSIAGVLVALLAVGTVMATMQVAHSALEARRREIGTLRVLGFDGRAAAISILLETLPFAALGAWIAAGLVWFCKDGDLMTGAWSVIEIHVDFQLVLVATSCAVTIAMLGTLPLALKTLRRRELEGLQDLRDLDQATLAKVRSMQTGVASGVLRQILAVTRIGFSTLPQRSRSVWLIGGGVFCTMFVLLWFLSMAEGIRSAILDSGDPARVVLRSSTTRWPGESRIPEGVEALAARAPGVARAADGRPLAEAVLYATVLSVRRSNGRPTGTDLIGVGPHWREMTPSFRLLSGRLPTPGTHEVIVGRLAQRALLGLDGGPKKGWMGLIQKVGEREFNDVEWQVVGTFTTGDWHDGHLIGDIATLRQYSGGLTATAVWVRLDSPQSFDAFKRAVAPLLPPSVKLERERDHYAALWDAVPKNVLFVAYVLGFLLASGAIIATMQVAHSALEARRREIATLRVLGFDGRAVAVSILIEALPFALLGAMMAAGVIWLWRDGDLWAGAGSVFEFKVNLHLVLLATGLAVTIAILGTLPLALKTLRQRELEGLQDLRETERTLAPVRECCPGIWRPSIGLGVGSALSGTLLAEI